MSNQDIFEEMKRRLPELNKDLIAKQMIYTLDECRRFYSWHLQSGKSYVKDVKQMCGGKTLARHGKDLTFSTPPKSIYIKKGQMWRIVEQIMRNKHGWLASRYGAAARNLAINHNIKYRNPKRPERTSADNWRQINKLSKNPSSQTAKITSLGDTTTGDFVNLVSYVSKGYGGRQPDMSKYMAEFRDRYIKYLKRQKDPLLKRDK